MKFSGGAEIPTLLTLYPGRIDNGTFVSRESKMNSPGVRSVLMKQQRRRVDKIFRISRRRIIFIYDSRINFG